MERLLVIGAESVVGANLACTLADRFEVTALSCGAPVDFEGCATATRSPHDHAHLTQCIRDVAPAWIAYCGAVARSSWDEPTVEHLSRLADEPRRAAVVSAAAQQVGCRLTVISNDAVFTGPRIFHGEAAPAYGTGKLAEAALALEKALAESPALIVRTHAYGWGPHSAAVNYAEAFWEALDSGVWPAADSHRHATPILASDLAELLAAAYGVGLHGLYHIAGAERTSPRQFVSALASELNVVSAPRSAPSQDAAPQPVLETSLVCRRARQALGQPLPMLREGLARFAAQVDDGYRDRLRGKDALVPLRATAA
jgi:dTDP-4-dehydrorhamnose reductase